MRLISSTTNFPTLPTLAMHQNETIYELANALPTQTVQDPSPYFHWRPLHEFPGSGSLLEHATGAKTHTHTHHIVLISEFISSPSLVL